jgi:hypothetical protein
MARTRIPGVIAMLLGARRFDDVHQVKSIGKGLDDREMISSAEGKIERLSQVFP